VIMKIRVIIICVATLLIFSAHGQGSFQNLDFEAANISPVQPPSSTAIPALALPDWNISYGSSGFYDTNVILYGIVQGAGNPIIVLLGTNGIGGTSIEGSFSVFLQGASVRLIDGTFIPVNTSISQTGLVPADTESIFFEAQSGTETFAISLNGPKCAFYRGSNTAELHFIWR
jgi:hypothetical protein